MEKYVYEKIKADGAINLSGQIFNSNGYYELEIKLTNTINRDTFDFSGGTKTYEAGDIITSFEGDNCYLIFFHEQTDFSSCQKVGEIEKSSLDGYRSFINGLNNFENINFTFTLKEPEQSESILKKMMTVIVIVISLTLFYIIYLLIQF